MADVSPNVPVCQALKEKIKSAIERGNRRVAERFRDAVPHRPKLQNLKMLKAKAKRSEGMGLYFYIAQVHFERDYGIVLYAMIRHECTSPQLSSMRIGDSSSQQSNAMASTPPLTQHFVHPGVSPSCTSRPSAKPDDEMPALAPGQKDRLGRVMIEPNGSSWHPAKDVAPNLKDCVRRLYTQAYHSWSNIPNSIHQAMFN
uniref:Uncharacterized protein n=1 Tax=Solanum tuberosum TaxID=4113 RepID=M1AUA2_SOLTU